MQDVKACTKDNGNYLLALPPLRRNAPQGSVRPASSGNNNYFAKFILMVFVTSCIVILFSSIISKTRQERIRILEAKKMLEKQAARLEEENSMLENEYSALKNDPVRIEKEARELLGYVGIDEVFYEKYNFRIKSVSKKEPAKIISQNPWKTFLFDGPFPWQFPALIILIASAYYLISYHYEYRKLRQSNC
jgi:cell division protein FtsB